ncbi:MAG: hypothetical protein JSS27_10645 [Planctomycetes bacterium]|nr:hypothetical protein [Planctomycetota bacterium]
MPKEYYKRVASSLAAVFVAYVVYALLVVPWVEPELVASDDVPVIVPDVSKTYVEQQREMLKQWFLPGDWELTTLKILETSYGILLAGEYKNRPDGAMEIKPCTVISIPEGDESTLRERQRQAIIMRAPEGAILQFDGPLDLKRSQGSQLRSGQLIGAVTIRSDNSEPGPQDDLLIHASNLELSQQRIYSTQPLDFQMGPNRGRGRRLQIQMAAGKQNVGFRGMTSLEIAQDVEMRLEPGQSDMFPGKSNDPKPAIGPSKPQPPVEIRCKGPFRFDFEQRVATFRDRVDVRRLTGTPNPDSMTGDLLSLTFIEAAQKASATEPTPTKPGAAEPKRDQLHLEPKRVEMLGSPVMVRAPSSALEAMGQQLEYDVASGGVTLRGANQVQLVHEGRQIQAREVFAKPGVEGSLGEFRALGPGWLRGSLPDDPSQPILARWTTIAHFRPSEGQQLLSLEGDAHVEAGDQGSLDASKIYLWLVESPPKPVVHVGPAEGPRRNEMRPDRMLAQGSVKIKSPSVTGEVEELQAWFEPASPAPHVVRREPVGAPPGVREEAIAPGVPAPVFAPAGMAHPPRGVRVDNTPRQPKGPPAQQFHVEGKQMRIRARLTDTSMELADLFIEQNVKLTETRTAKPDDKPLKIVGQQLHLQQPQPGAEIVSVSGKPAYIEARSLTMVSDVVRLNRGQNLMWTDGAGSMSVPVQPKAADGTTKPGPPIPLDVSWQGQMQFDGLVARFERNVEARHATQALKTQLLEAKFSKPVSFQASPDGGSGQLDPGGDPTRPDISQLSCRQGVWLENRTIVENTLQSIDTMQMEELDLWQATGDVSGAGPGAVTSIRLGQAGDALPGAQQGAIPAAPALAAPGQNGGAPGIVFLHVRFQRGLSGNLQRHQIQFDNQVRAVYGPIPTWETRLDIDRPETWGPRGVGLSSDKLNLVEAPSLVRGKSNLELEAIGNTLVEGTGFTARANRLTYSQGKDMLVLEGDGRTPARLYRQMRVGAPPVEAAARKIQYWPGTGRSDVSDVQILDLTEIPGMGPRK